MLGSLTCISLCWQLESLVLHFIRSAWRNWVEEKPDICSPRSLRVQSKQWPWCGQDGWARWDLEGECRRQLVRRLGTLLVKRVRRYYHHIQLLFRNLAVWVQYITVNSLWHCPNGEDMQLCNASRPFRIILLSSNWLLVYYTVLSIFKW